MMTCPECNLNNRAPNSAYCNPCTAEMEAARFWRNVSLAASALVSIGLMYWKPEILLAMGAVLVVIGAVSMTDKTD